MCADLLTDWGCQCKSHLRLHLLKPSSMSKYPSSTCHPMLQLLQYNMPGAHHVPWHCKAPLAKQVLGAIAPARSIWEH